MASSIPVIGTRCPSPASCFEICSGSSSDRCKGTCLRARRPTTECAAPPIPRLDFEYISSNCCAQSGYHYKLTTDGVARLNKPMDDIARIIECNEHCQCQSDPTQIRIRYVCICNSMFVIEFVGEVLNRHEIEHRSTKNYMLTVNEMHQGGARVNSISIDPLRSSTTPALRI